MDPVIHLSEGHRSDMLLDLSGLTREERIMVQASISNARDFDRVCRQIHLTRDFFPTYWTLCTHHIVAPRCRSVCLTKSLVITCLSVGCFFVFFLSLSFLYSLSHCLPVLCPAHQLPQCRHRRGIKPLHSRTMRSIASWRYTTLSQVMSPTSSTTSTTRRLLQRSFRMSPAT